MHLYLAFFWLVMGVIMQVYWTELSRLAFIPVDRTVLSFIFFALFSYNFIRWRVRRIIERNQREAKEALHRHRRADVESDPALDFSDPKVEEPEKK